MSAAKPKSDLFSELLEGLTAHPSHLLILMMVVATGLLSIQALIIGFVMMIAFQLVRPTIKRLSLALVVLAGFGCLFAVLLYEIGGVSPPVIHQENLNVLSDLLHGQGAGVFRFYDWFIGMPYGVMLGSFLTVIRLWSTGLSEEVKRVGQGRLASSQPPITSHRLAKKLARFSEATLGDGTLLGLDIKSGEPVVLSDSEANCHTLVIGTTGVGKTTGLCNIMESAILRRLPLIIVDGKGDIGLSQRIEGFAALQGRRFYGFSLLGKSVKYNPLASGGITSKKDRIIALRSWSEDHYRKIAEGYLQTVLKVLEASRQHIDLKQLARFLEPEVLMQTVRQMGSGNNELLQAVSALKDKRRDIESLVAEIENLAMSEVGDLFDTQAGTSSDDVLILEKALDEGAVVYFCLQPLAFPQYAENLGKLIINDIKQLAAMQLLKPHKPKLYTVFDEFSVFAGEQIIHLINQGRSAGIHAILSTQSLSDIERVGGEALVGQILNNCNNYIIQRQNNPKDAEVLTSIIGTFDDFEVTSQVQTDKSGSSVGTVRGVKAFLIHPDEIKRLGLGEAVFVAKQQFKVARVRLRQSGILR